MDHTETDVVSLEIACQVAERLRSRPELLDVGRANLVRWTQRNADAGSLLRCYEESESILAHPIGEICALLCSETEEGRRLRQNSPFAGVLSPAEVWQIKSRRYASATA